MLFTPVEGAVNALATPYSPMNPAQATPVCGDPQNERGRFITVNLRTGWYAASKPCYTASPCECLSLHLPVTDARTGQGTAFSSAQNGQTMTCFIVPRYISATSKRQTSLMGNAGFADNRKAGRTSFPASFELVARPAL
jgi:hypothetical protein